MYEHIEDVMVDESRVAERLEHPVWMNEKAEEIGMINTNFLNSSGWPEDDHYSTVYDLAVLSNALIREFPDLYLYFSDKECAEIKLKLLNSK